MASSKIFSLEGKGLKLDTAQDIEPHIAALVALEDVEEVRFLGNTLGVGACERLGEVLATKKSLKSANFADLFTGRLLNEIPAGISAILTAILNHPHLTTVNLNDNAFGLNTQAPLVAFLSAHVPLQHLYLNNNGLGPHAGILVADALSELHAKKEAARKEGKQVPDLETVICGRNRLESGSMAAWAKAYSLHNKIQEIKMVQNGIRQEGISRLLSEGLNTASQLRILDLQDNTFTIMGAEALAKVVPKWEDIRELGVGDSLLSDEGARLLAESLLKGKNKKLETLRLQYNEIKADGVRAVANASKAALPALKRIELNGNKFTEDEDAITILQELLEERKEQYAGDIIIEDEWGVDSLSDLEEDSDLEAESEEEEEEEEEEEQVKEKAEKFIKDAEEAQKQPIAQRQDEDVDDLAKKLENTQL